MRVQRFGVGVEGLGVWVWGLEVKGSGFTGWESGVRV